MKTLTDLQFDESAMAPDWNEYYMAMALLVSTKSKDPSTKCGAVLVDTDNRVLSIGYNGAYRGYPDSETVIERPAKYHYWLHAEENALLNYSGSRSDMQGATMYITGRPCTRCLRMMIQSGIKCLVYSKSRRLAIFDNEDGTDKAWDDMVENCDICIEENDFDANITNIFTRATSIMEDRKEEI